MILLRSACAGLFLSACGGAPTPEAKPVSTVTNAVTTDESSTAAPPSRGGGTALPYAPSPLTDLAKAVTQLTISVLDGKPPAGPIPIERIRPGRDLVSGSPPRPSEIEFFMFGIEMIVVLDDADDGAIRVVAMLGKTGLRLVNVRSSQGRKTTALPGWLAGAGQVGSEVVEAARRGNLDGLVLRESDRSMFGDDKLFDLAMSERPKAERLDEIEALVKKYPRLRGVIVDELYLLARGGPGDFWGFQLNVDEDDGQMVLDSAPLINVAKKNTSEIDAAPAEDPPPPPPPPPPIRKTP